MVVRRQGEFWEVQAPAKLNLHLEVLAKRTDGFHEIETLMTPVSIYDTLRLRPTSDPALRLDCRWAAGLETRLGAQFGPLPAMEENLVYRALALFRQASGAAQGAEVDLVKRIPAQAGLGGASADAAAALLAANQGWRVDWPLARLADLAARLGSDIPFFFSPGAAICRGRGERIETLAAVPPVPVVVLRPPVGLSTPAVYRACRVPATPKSVEPLRAALARGDTPLMGRLLWNRLQEPAEELSEWIVRARDAFAGTDCLGSRMSGSGTSYFGICRNAHHARRVAHRLRSQGWEWVASGSTGGLA